MPTLAFTLEQLAPIKTVGYRQPHWFDLPARIKEIEGGVSLRQLTAIR